MPIYIALEFDDQPIGAVLAESEKLASAYFQGRDIYPHHFKILSEDDLGPHPTGVIPIFMTRLVQRYDVGDRGVLEVVRL